MVYGALFLFTLLNGPRDPRWTMLGPIYVMGLLGCIVQCFAVANVIFHLLVAASVHTPAVRHWLTRSPS